MRTEQPKMIYLKDYQVPDYLIDETHLTFELFDDHTLVHAQLLMRRNPAAGSGLSDACRRWCWTASSWSCSVWRSTIASWVLATTN